MNPRPLRHWLWCVLLALLSSSSLRAADPKPEKHFLYVAEPGIRDYLEFGGHGVLVFDIDNGHKFVKRIPSSGVDEKGKPINVKGICASAATQRLYVSTIKTLMCFDLLTEKILWEKPYEGGCDRMAISPDGQIIYLPSFEKDHWHVLNALTGDIITKIIPKSGAHNTVYGLDGRHAYLAGLKSPLLRVTDTKTHTIEKEVGPFSASIRPFTVNYAQTLCYANVNELLGFEIGDLQTGKMIQRVEVTGFKKGPVKRHGCPSHGIGLTPDEKQIWLCDGANQQLHVFDNTVMPPKQIASIPVREQPGWVTFSLDGKYAYPSTGDVIEVATRKIVTGLTDETGAQVHSEKMVEIHFRDGKPIRTGDQFGLGRKAATK
jgi:DNA-binding beta-propeller fold protein YncE